MKFMRWILFSTVTSILAVAQPVLASTPTVNSGISNVPLTNTSGTIERGGTITDVNDDKKTITVDGITYPFAYSIAVTAADNLFASQHTLRKGMRIRFGTVKDTASRQEKVTEILIINRRPPQK